jgi:uncharacterized membrane protein YeaQ/YmgE (transglycosylase-associated protein family)
MKSAIWIGMTVGSIAGSFIPSLWGSGEFSFSSIFFTAVGGAAGIWLAYNFSRD